MSSRKAHDIPAVAGPTVKIANGQASATEVQVICLPVDDRALADHARMAHVAVYMSDDSEVGLAQHQLRATISEISQAADRNRFSKKQLGKIALYRRAIKQEKDFAVLAGIGTLDVDGEEIRALLVYCAPSNAVSVKVALPVAWLCPTSRSAIH